MSSVIGKSAVLDAERRNREGTSWAEMRNEFGTGIEKVRALANRVRSFGEDSIVDAIQVPIEPLWSYIESRGGLEALLPGRPEWVERGQAAEGGNSNLLCVFRRSPEAEKLFIATESRLYKARVRGAIDYYHADEICCDVLNMHPALIYGEQWWDFPDTHVARVRKVEVRTERAWAA